MTPEDFKRAFPFDGERLCSERALVHLGLPRPDEIVLCFVPSRSGSAADLLRVSVEPPGKTAPPVVFNLGIRPRRFDAVRQRITGLRPGTGYRIEVTVRGEEGPRQVHAWTAPAADDPAPFSFLAFSCFAPFAATSEATRFKNMDTLRRFEQRARGNGAPAAAFGIGMGDQVYVDAGRSRNRRRVRLLGGKASSQILYEGAPEEYLDLLYRAHFSFVPFSSAFSHMPSALMWDDHEVCDGWGSQGDEPRRIEDERWRSHYAAARRWFVGFQAMRNPVDLVNGDTEDTRLEQMARASDAFPGKGAEMHFQFDWGSGCTFFVMDLRSQRSLDQVIGDAQLQSLEAWLEPRGGPPRLYVLVSSIPLTLPKWVRLDPARCLPSRGDDVRDQWWSDSGRRQGTRLKELLAERFSDGRDRLLVLSGDVHYSEVRRLETDSGRFIGHEVISSGLSQDSFIPDVGRFGFIEDTIDRFRAAPLKSTSISRYHGAGFAELYVTPRSGRPPSVEIRGHFGRNCGGTPARRPIDEGFEQVV